MGDPYKLSQTPEAEAECQKEGGHLASVASKVVNEDLKQVTGGRYVYDDDDDFYDYLDYYDNSESSTLSHTRFVKMVQLAQCLRIKDNLTEGQILDKVIQEKMRNIDILQEDGICANDQIKSDNLNEIIPKLVLLVEMKNQEGPATASDIMTGFKLYHAIVF